MGGHSNIAGLQAAGTVASVTNQSALALRLGLRRGDGGATAVLEREA